jgi:hypothetical protein
MFKKNLKKIINGLLYLSGLQRILGVTFYSFILITKLFTKSVLNVFSGPKWGENGYVRIARNYGGMCSIAALAAQVIV